jgi:hypothetical protein
MTKHSSADQSRLNGNIFLVRGGVSHQPTRPLHLPHRSPVLESLITKNSSIIESFNDLLHIQSSVQCKLVSYNQHRILHDVIHRTIRIVLRSVLVISGIVTIILFFKSIKSTNNSDEKLSST